MSILNITRCSLLPIRFSFQLPCNSYAKKESAAVNMVAGGLGKKKKIGKLGPMMEKKVLPVEADPNKLVNFVCGSNIYKTGEDLKVRPDSEYPEWLWNLRIGPTPTLEELEPDSKDYYLRVRKMAMRRNNKMAQLKSF